MLGLGLPKLILLALMIAIIWYGYRYLQRIEAVRRALRDELMRRQRATARPSQPVEAEDLVKCATCSAYVPSHHASACGRPDCPWRR
ncbi:MAG TPA: hypothetical protein VGP50_06730 [Stellaceae bacterium]|jgi:ribosomal protein L32|nr:hypothetical protein [Stellaceae bacterium]